MKKSFFIVIAFVVVFTSCGKAAKDNPETVSDTTIIKEYFSTGKIKTEISAIGELRQGWTRNYDQQSRLLSEVFYVNNLKEGIARNYYTKTGKLNSTIEYKNGIKQGDEIWYYESGKQYRVTPYANGIMDGTRKLYYENGNLMAEIPFRNGYPGIGLREYKPDGTLIKDYPHLLIRKEDHLSSANKVLLFISLTGKADVVKFYKGPLLAGKYLHKNMLLLATQKDVAQIDFNIPPGASVNQITTVTASLKTPMGNPLITSRKYNLQAINLP